MENLTMKKFIQQSFSEKQTGVSPRKSWHQMNQEEKKFLIEGLYKDIQDVSIDDLKRFREDTNLLAEYLGRIKIDENHDDDENLKKKAMEAGKIIEKLEKIQHPLNRIKFANIKRKTTRNDQDRLILSLERMNFQKNLTCGWRKAMFMDSQVILLEDREENIYRERMTSFQRKVLDENKYLYWRLNKDLYGKWIQYSDLNIEAGSFEYSDENFDAWSLQHSDLVNPVPALSRHDENFDAWPLQHSDLVNPVPALSRHDDKYVSGSEFHLSKGWTYLQRVALKARWIPWGMSFEPERYEDELINCGGEAIVLKHNFGKTCYANDEFSRDFTMALRIQTFDSKIFGDGFDMSSIKFETNRGPDFKKADRHNKHLNDVIPEHPNIIYHFYNVRMFDKNDYEKNDCLGWLTFMEYCPTNLRDLLKKDSLDLKRRKKALLEILSGLNYLEEIGIHHYDLKPENILLDIDGTAKIIDFGLVEVSSCQTGFRKMGYCRDGSKFKTHNHLYSGSPAFCCGQQLVEHGEFRNQNIFVFLACDWKSAWTLLYKPLEDDKTYLNQRRRIKRILKDSGACWLHNFIPSVDNINDLQKIVVLENCASIYCLNDPNLTKSTSASSIKSCLTRQMNFDFQNVTMNVIDQKDSDLCVPITVATLLKHAMKSDLNIDSSEYTVERILTHITMEIYPRSMAGLNLNPKEAEKDFQENDIQTLLERLVSPTYLSPSGWDIIREYKLPRSTCHYSEVLLNENYLFSRPLTVTGAYFAYPEHVIIFHQMVLDHIDEQTNEYVLQNTLISHWHSSLRIKKDQPYYATEEKMKEYWNIYQQFKFHGENGEFMWLANENVGQTMEPNKWYLLPQAYSITLSKTD